MTKPSHAKGEAKQKDRFRAVRREMRVKQSIVLLFCALVTYWFLFDAGPGHAWFLEHVAPHVSTILAIVLQLIMGLAMMILQFIGLMWFLAGAKVTWIMPGEATAKSLDDYIGQPIVLRQLREIVDILNGASKIVAMGGRPPIGGLVAGPPGSGKTYAAKCIGGSAMCPV
ncbi:MAG: hypothetical protein GWN58_40280, partial [Anaerolineae bacterium]|nr:hypothetical protein [Anaerolineae bacterium]